MEEDTVVNHKDACPLLALEASDKAGWVGGFAIKDREALWGISLQ